ncbi:MAG TPA: VOC family protein [Rhizomicrobium sp.]|jgi:catechol 2,3-dioxygenase-like lactoylglutathione lyase family enzyme
MLHHVSVGVRDVASAAAFYDAVLGALGYKRTAQYLPYAIAYGEGVSEFWIQLPHDREAPSPGNGAHVGFSARSQDAVHRFHKAALDHGGTDDGPPGPRPDYGPDYFGAFVLDPFGNKVEATLHIVTKKKAAPRAKAKAKAKPAARRSVKAKSKAKRPAKKSAKRKARRR